MMMEKVLTDLSKMFVLTHKNYKGEEYSSPWDFVEDSNGIDVHCYVPTEYGKVLTIVDCNDPKQFYTELHVKNPSIEKMKEYIEKEFPKQSMKIDSYQVKPGLTRTSLSVTKGRFFLTYLTSKKEAFIIMIQGYSKR